MNRVMPMEDHYVALDEKGCVIGIIERYGRTMPGMWNWLPIRGIPISPTTLSSAIMQALAWPNK